MIRAETIVESQEASIGLTSQEAEALDLIGRRLASQQRWWGDEEQDPAERSVIRCRRRADGDWTILVREAIGVISVKSLVITILPKIPQSHFLYLAIKSGQLPRIDEQPIEVARGANLWTLIAIWYITAAERLLRRELARGYANQVDEIDAVRGQILTYETALGYYRGARTVRCQFDEFDTDIELNRVIKKAAEVIASGQPFDPRLRRRAKAILYRLEGVGEFRPSDIYARADRLTKHYTSALSFAKYVIAQAGVDFAPGTHLGWSFLIRTPEIVEAGVRATLAENLPQWSIAKRRLKLSPSSVTINPDLVINDGWVTGDVKYSRAQPDWQRQHLYQAVAFASAFRAQAAVVIGFSGGSDDPLPSPVTVGDLKLRYFAWVATGDIEPVSAGRKLAVEFDDWLRALPADGPRYSEHYPASQAQSGNVAA